MPIRRRADGRDAPIINRLLEACRNFPPAQEIAAPFLHWRVAAIRENLHPRHQPTCEAKSLRRHVIMNAIFGGVRKIIGLNLIDHGCRHASPDRIAPIDLHGALAPQSALLGDFPRRGFCSSLS